MWQYRKIHLRRAPLKAKKVAKKLLWVALIIFLIASAACAVNLYQESKLPGAEQAALVSRKPLPKDWFVALLYMLGLLVAVAAFFAKAIIDGKEEQWDRLSNKTPNAAKRRKHETSK
jgi:cytochrome bd-type quinol oxidase subunit 2